MYLYHCSFLRSAMKRRSWTPSRGAESRSASGRSLCSCLFILAPDAPFIPLLLIPIIGTFCIVFVAASEKPFTFFQRHLINLFFRVPNWRLSPLNRLRKYHSGIFWKPNFAYDIVPLRVANP